MRLLSPAVFWLSSVRDGRTLRVGTVVNDGHGDYVFVPAGAFKMGDNFGDGEARERPVHVVELDAFYIAKYEMTNGEWRKFRDDPGYEDAKFWPEGRVVPKDQSPYWNDARNHGGGTPDSDNYPLLGVNWDSATAYCNWLSEKTGKKYRLPTEAEWEKAARGTDQRRYPWGNEIDHSYARTMWARRRSTRARWWGRTQGDVSPYGASIWRGNVMEWCADWYSAIIIRSRRVRIRRGRRTGAYRVMRGGTFFLEAFDLRTYARSAAWPSFQGHRMIGFRAVREP